jgi:hypothetical protein
MFAKKLQIMKKLSLFLFSLLIASLSISQSTTKGSLIVKVTPVTIFRNMLFTAHGEYAVSDQLTIGLGLSPNLAPKSNILDGITQETGNYTYQWTSEGAKPLFSVDPEVRWYADNVMDGFFFGAYSSFRFSSSYLIEYNNSFGGFSNSETGNKLKMNTRVMVVGPQCGWEKLLGKSDRFVFDGFIGLGLKITSRSYSGEVEGPGYDNSSLASLGLRGNVSIGYRIK